MSIFNSIQTKKPRLNKFDLSHEVKLSMKMGKLYPTMVQEIVPGDKFQVNSETLIRLAPMLAPIMHRVDVFTHYFFVPNRLVWSEWEDFITGGEDGDSLPPFPTITISSENASNFRKGKLPDYMGVPIIPDSVTDGNVTPMKISRLPFSAYNLIYNEYYRDQNLETKLEIYKGISNITGNGGTLNLTTIRNRAWEKDYFTSSLPWSQRGGEAKIPLGKVEPNYKPVTDVVQSDGGFRNLVNPLERDMSTSGTSELQDDLGNALRIENLGDMNVDATTINELRKANRLQQWLEKSARGGSRYIEQILSHFGVKSSDARLQRPEYLGGGKQPVVISEVLSTVQTDTIPQAEMAGHGISVGSHNGFSKTFEEHGFVLAIVSVLPKSAYQQGLDRKWTKFDKFDYYWPEFAHLGEQEVKQKELYIDYKAANDPESTFGYQQRYAEYKYNPTTVHGDFRDNLAFWHMGRIFDAPPTLSKEFIHAQITKRIFAVTDPTVDELYVQIYHKVNALRPMPYFSIPSL